MKKMAPPPFKKKAVMPKPKKKAPKMGRGAVPTMRGGGLMGLMGKM